MKLHIALLLTFTVLLAPGSLFAQDAHPDKAVCQVCSERGTGEGVEKVRGVSEYEGETYYFCSKDCKKVFDADPAGYLPQVFPRSAPGLNAVDLIGNTTTLTEYNGSVLLVDFWATWCKPCVKIMPELQKLQATYEDKGFKILGIAIDEDPKKVKKFLAKRDLDYRFAIDDIEAPTWEAYGVKAVPTSFLIGRDGRIVARWVGQPDFKELTETVAQFLEQEPKSD